MADEELEGRVSEHRLGQTRAKVVHDDLVSVIEYSITYRGPIKRPWWLKFIPGGRTWLESVIGQVEHNAELAAYIDAARALEDQFPGLPKVSL